jgi:hypothetical protein
MTPTREQVRKLAREADIIDWRDEDGDEHVEQMIDSLMVIWQAARAQALDDAAGVCDEPGIYTKHDMQQAIMELKGKQ